MPMDMKYDNGVRIFLHCFEWISVGFTSIASFILFKKRSCDRIQIHAHLFLTVTILNVFRYFVLYVQKLWLYIEFEFIGS